MLATFFVTFVFFSFIKSASNIQNQSPTSQNCRLHISSPTSVTNIDVTQTIDRTILGVAVTSAIDVNYGT